MYIYILINTYIYIHIYTYVVHTYIYNVGNTIINYPPVITIFIGGMDGWLIV